MKKDEIDLLAGLKVDIPIKRLNYIYKKWNKNGILLNYTLTHRFHEIQNLIKNKHKNIKNWYGQVVIVRYLYNKPPSAGILSFYDTDACIFHTRKQLQGFYLSEEDIAFVELHPNPANIWRKLNYYYWKFYKISDYFHVKYTKFSYVIPLGNKIGDCRPVCPCKSL